ncbi:MAG: RNA-processing protein [Candidatus Aenigmarchaeota archaeon]|nr:RNA-processing protein [Candidatus Aenigmarchaeota archaeon]
MIEIVRIPEERKPVLIGKDGRVKQWIEKGTGASIEVSDAVEISGDDPLGVLKAKEIVTAIGRGFSPKTCRRLLDEGCELRVISLEGETEKKRRRLFGRVIGRAGRSREKIESDTGTRICVFGKTLSLIGKPEETGPAEDAVEELLAGKKHSWAYRKMRMKKSGELEKAIAK